jgi:GT2 family glycosyltransferase
MSAKPLVVCVILNTNRRDDTLECLRSLAANTYERLQTIVLDCQSHDGSVPAIRGEFPNVRVVELTENRGYAGNNNVGIKLALQQGAEWVFVLNEDTVLASDCVARLVGVGEQDQRIGVVGPIVFHHDEPGIIQSAGGGINRRWEGFHIGQNEVDTGRFREPYPVQWISGCGILIRAAVIEQVGLIDERFFIYWEETEWCVRAGKAGWRLMLVPDARLWHKGVQRNYNPRPDVTYYSTRNRLLMLSKHHAPLRAWVVAWLQLSRTLASWTVKPKWRHKRGHRDALAAGILDFFGGRWGRRGAKTISVSTPSASK